MSRLYVLAVHTGMRRGELLGLKWEDIDLDGQTVRVRRTLLRIDDGRRLALESEECTLRSSAAEYVAYLSGFCKWAMPYRTSDLLLVS